MPESWIVIGIFIINLVFFLIMSFVSKYYKHELAEGLGSVFNIVWIAVIIVVGAIIMMYNVQCTIDGRCQGMAWLIIAILVGLTALNIGLSTYRTLSYKEHSEVSQEAKKV